MTDVHLVLPAGIDDPGRPSGGNVYDRRVSRGLRHLGWTVREHQLPGAWPNAKPSDRAALSSVLAGIPDDTVVLVDGLIASKAPGALAPQAGRLRLVILLHMPLDVPEEREALLAADAIVTTSRWTRGWVHERYAMPTARMHVVPPGVDPAESAPGTPAGGRLLCVGALTPIKGQDLLLGGLAAIGDLDWSCRCVGAVDVDAPFVARLLDRRLDVGLADRVTFTGALTGADLDRAYAESDILLLTSRADSYGMVVTEALARGLPVIATDVGGVSEALGRAADGDLPGMLIPPGDAGALAGALRDWLGDPGARERLRAAARSRSRSLTGWAQTSGGLADVLARVASGKAMNHSGDSAV